MKKILIVNPYYLPGYRSGGPQQTFLNIVDVFGKEYEFYVLTLNHDFKEKEPYQGITLGWNTVGNARVQYISEEELSVETISKYCNDMDLVYAGGLFEKTTVFVAIASRLNKIQCTTYVAPMGVFSDGAISHKTLKKKLFLFLARLLKLYKNVRWSFTSQLELEEYKKHMGEPKYYQIASDIPQKPYKIKKDLSKKQFQLKIVFLSRICSQKNLLYAIRILSQIEGQIQFDIYGIKEDQIYWEECCKELNKLPQNIKWTYFGAVKSEDVVGILTNYHAFILPTLGENFGHVIYEALLAGCVPVISDKTPWNEISNNSCGEVCSLDDEYEFVRAVEYLRDLTDNEFFEISRRCSEYANRKYEELVTNSGYRKIFEEI